MAVAGVARIRHQHLVAALDQRQAGELQRRRGARGDHDARRVDLHAEALRVPLRDALAQRREAGGVGVLRAAVADGPLGGLLLETLVDDVGPAEGLLQLRSEAVTAGVLPSAKKCDAALAELLRHIAEGTRQIAVTHTVRIGARRDAGTLSAWVEDAGPGLPEGAQENVFERFSRGGVEPAPSGMGLGLSISRSIAERHGGSIRCEPREGGGSCFVLTLPAS